MKVTLDDIAKECKVSKSTVSKALRGSSDINPMTSMQIVNTANRMGYHRVKETSVPSKEIVIICPELISDYYSLFTETLSRLLSEKGYYPCIAVTNFDQDRELEIIDFYLSKIPAAIICITENTSAAQKLSHASEKIGIAILLITLNTAAKECDNICIDEEMSMDYAIQHLISLGHTQLGFIGEKRTMERLVLFENCAKKHDIPICNDCIAITDSRFSECGYTGMKQILDAKNRPTAIIAAYDDIALGAIRMINESGYSVPDDFSIIGIDNAHYATYLPAALTTIDCRINDMSSIAVEILNNKIKDKSLSVVQNISIKPDLLLRETTKPPRKVSKLES